MALRTHDPTAVGLLRAETEFDVVLALGIDQANGLVHREFAPRFAQDSPKAALPRLQEETLPMAAGALAASQQSGRHYAGIVKHQAIAGPKNLRQVANMVMGQRLLAAIDDQ